MKKLKYFSGIKPTLENLEYDQSGKEEAILNRQREMFSDGVLIGLNLVENEGIYSIQPGVGYVNGERIEITDAQDVDIIPTEESQFVFLIHKNTLSHPVPHFVTGEDHNIYQSDGFDIEIRDNDNIGEDELLITEVSNSGILDRRTFIRLAVDDRLHTQDSDSGTTEDEFRVGIGNPAHPEGLKVLTESPVPKPPLNVRITSIQSDFKKKETSELSTNAGQISGMARVFLAWDYRDIVGESVATNIFRIDNSEYSFSENELEGYYLTFVSGEEFLITGNETTANGQTLVTILGDLDSISASTHPAIINPGVTEYLFSAIPVNVGENTNIITDQNLVPPPISSLPVDVNQRIEGAVRLGSSPVLSNSMLRLPLGEYYIFQVQSVRRQAESVHTVMGAGSYSWKGNQIAYTHPYKVSLPQLNPATLSVGIMPEGRGFVINIAGWEDADLYEYGWVKLSDVEGGNINFDNADHHLGVSANRTINIYTLEDFIEVVANPNNAAQLVNLNTGLPIVGSRLRPIRNRYLFAVRPLFGGQVVGETVTTEVVLEVDPFAGQAAVVKAIQTLTGNLDNLNKTVRNIDAIRQNQVAMVEDQLLTLNSQLTDGQHYSRFDLAANVTLPFPEVGEVQILGSGVDNEAYHTFDLDPSATEQTFIHNLGHQNYVVQVRDGDGNIIDAEIDINDNDVTVSFAEAMIGTLIVIDAEKL